jgi:hypothetical protein
VTLSKAILFRGDANDDAVASRESIPNIVEVWARQLRLARTA